MHDTIPNNFIPMELISLAPDSILHKTVHKFVIFPVGTEYTQ